MSKISNQSNKHKKISSEVKKKGPSVHKKKEDVKKNTSNKKAPETAQWAFSHKVAFWGLAALLFLPPYFRGLFFQPEQERALIFAAVIFWFAWLWKWSKHDNGFIRHPLDYFVLAFPVVYLISAFQAANYGLAAGEVVKTTLYFMVYWLSSRLVRNENDTETILKVIYVSAVGVALAGLATATGIIHINDGFLNGRIYSTFQYPNALASFLAAAIFIGFYLWRRAGLADSGDVDGETKSKDITAWLNINNINQYLYATGNFLLIAVLIGTRSQGGLLVFSVVFILFLIGLAKGDRIPIFTHFILTGLFSTIAIWRFLTAVAAGSMGLAWLWILAGLVLATAGQVLYSFSERKGLPQWIAIHRNIVIAAVLLLAVCGGIGAGIYISGQGDAVKNLAEEIRLRNATERMYFFQDAMKMFKDRPVIGWGGGGWQEAYRAFQGYFYNSNQVHGHYFQIMVETGVFGLLTILGIWVCFLYAAHKLYYETKKNKGNYFLVWIITVAALSMGIHAVIDFDLSLSALALVLWAMFGLLRGVGTFSPARAEEKKSKKYVPSNYSLLAAVSGFSVIIILFAGSLAAAGSYAKQGVRSIQGQNVSQGIELLQKASVYSPLNADHPTALARVYQAVGKYDEAIAEAQRAVSLSKYSATRYADLAALHLANKNNEEAVHAAEKTLALAPFQIQWYELLARTCFAAGYNELTAGNKETAKQYLEKAIRAPGKTQDRTDSLGETEKRLWKDAPLLSPTPGIKLSVGKSQYILGMWPEAEANLSAALQDDNNKGEAALWLSILRDKQGKAQEAKDLFAQASELAPQLAEGYEGLKSIQVLAK